MSKLKNAIGKGLKPLFSKAFNQKECRSPNQKMPSNHYTQHDMKDKSVFSTRSIKKFLYFGLHRYFAPANDY